MDNSTAILVLGMPRSGTSAVTRVLNLHGAALSDHLLPAAKPNPKGFFESADALAIHERLLASMGRSWFDISEMPEGWIDFQATRQAEEELTELVRRDFIDKALWVIKEPRMCRIVPLWLKVLHNLNITPRILLVTRHPDEVVSSVARMVGEDEWGAEHTQILWLQYFFDAEKATRKLPRAIITYDQLLKDWRLHVARVARELEIEWPVSSDSTGAKIDNYLGAENRHHTHALVYRGSDERLSMAERVYSICDAIKGDYWKVLSSIQSEFATAFSFFQRPMQDLIHKAAKHHKAAFLAQQVELNDLRLHHNNVFFAQHSELEELRASLEIMKKKAAEKEVNVRALSEKVESLSVALSLAEAKEKEISVDLLDAQSSYSALLALTESRKWLVRRIFTKSKENIDKL